MQNSNYTEIVNQIKDKLDIVDIVQNSVVLKKNGANYWGLCPFHNEKTPSFSVNPQKQIYKCFGCGEGGDVFSFIMKTQGLSFSEIIKEYAQKFGIDLPNNFSSSKDLTDKKNIIVKALSKASEIYSNNLLDNPEGKKAFDYLIKRGINQDIIQEYNLGFSLNDYQGLQNEIDKSKYSDDILEAAGLIIKKENKPGFVDRFRNRIMIPIYNESGEIIAFGARAIEENQNPKYLNSPDTIVYNKSKILYGIYQAKNSIKSEDKVIIMEGYFDVISTQANGIKNCVASCGTSLTLDHIKLISKYSASRRIYLSFDTDTAGQKAANRGSTIIKEALSGLGEIKQYEQSFKSLNTNTDYNQDKYSCEIRVISPLEGKDPDEFIRENGVEAYRKYIESAPLLIDYQVNSILKEKKENLSIQEKLQIINKLIPILKEINNKIVRSEYIEKISKELSINQAALEKELLDIDENRDNFKKKSSQIVKKSSNILEKTQKNLLSICLMECNTLNIQQLINIMQNVTFYDENLIDIKNTIDKLSCEVNNVNELVENLYSIYAQDIKKKNLITDLIYWSEKFKGLSDNDFLNVINESIKKLKDFELKKVKIQMKKEYSNISNEKDAIAYQMKMLKMMKTGDI